MEYLQELVRVMSRVILTPKERVEYYDNPLLMKYLYGKYPKCFVKVNLADGSSELYPICNRLMYIDPDVMKISIDALQKVIDSNDPNYDVNHAQEVLNTVVRLYNRYKRPIPSPPTYAAKKGMVTRMMNNIKKYIMMVNR